MTHLNWTALNHWFLFKLLPYYYKVVYYVKYLPGNSWLYNMHGINSTKSPSENGGPLLPVYKYVLSQDKSGTFNVLGFLPGHCAYTMAVNAGWTCEHPLTSFCFTPRTILWATLGWATLDFLFYSLDECRMNPVSIPWLSFVYSQDDPVSNPWPRANA